MTVWPHQRSPKASDFAPFDKRKASTDKTARQEGRPYMQREHHVVAVLQRGYGEPESRNQLQLRTEATAGASQFILHWVS